MGANLGGIYGAQLYGETYHPANNEASEKDQKYTWGMGAQINGGFACAVTNNAELTLGAVGRGGFNDQEIGGDESTLFGSVGLRGSIVFYNDSEPPYNGRWGGQIAAEAGYRFNSLTKDHPYLGLEISGPSDFTGRAEGMFFYFNPVVGITTNPEHFIDKDSLLEESSAYLGAKMLF